MGNFFNHNQAYRSVGFGQPYVHRPPPSWHYTLSYRGYDLDVARQVSVWEVGIHPRQPDLPLLRVRFKATAKTRRFSKPSNGWMRRFCPDQTGHKLSLSSMRTIASLRPELGAACVFLLR
jgi:hypothetical protein